VDASEPAVRDLVRAILDGTSVDWETIQSTADDTDRPLLDKLRVLAALADFHRGQRARGDGPQAQTWGHLRLLEQIGSGAFGRVYRAWDTRLDREVALKLMPARSAADPRASSIIEEGRLLARVRHPNVVTIYGAERIGDTVGLWMELIEGETVEQRLARASALNPSEVSAIGAQICGAVSAVHDAGLLHRDIKAQNVMLAPDGRAVLMDFGTGWDTADSDAARSLAGTPLYLAPELFREGKATAQSDVYSIGVLLYRMLTGAYPLHRRSLSELRVAHERHERGDAAGARRDIPRRLARVVDRAIDPRPERRYDSARALATALGALKRRPSPIPLTFAITAGVAIALAGWWAVDRRTRHEKGSASSQAASLTATLATRVSAPAIAVLPLTNLSTEAGSDEFADGFTEEIINGLATNEHLQVRSRTSSFAFKNTRRDVRDVATRLDVSFVLDGSIRRSGNRLQVDVRLLQASTGVVLWNQPFDTEIGKVFAVRDRITQHVAERIGVQGAISRRAYDRNPEAYGLYLAARALVSRRLVLGPQKAIEYFQQAIAIAPDFAPAYAGMADAYAHMSLPTYQGMPANKAQGLMLTAALKALELDPDLAEAHAAMGIVAARDLDWSRSQHEFQAAIALNPSLSQVYTNYSFFTLRPLRKFEEAEQLLEIALKSDPLSLDVWREIGQLYFTIGRYDEAIDLLQRVRAVDPEFPAVDVVLARALACRGRIPEALALYDAIASHGPAGALTASRPPEGVPHYLAYAYVKAGRRSDAERLAAENDQYPYRATIIYAALGDADRAFEALQRTADREPQRVPLLLTWPEMASLRGDPRFAAIEKRFGLP
jgi:serine/threonine protein kinase/tetratricopeptide (TPR) repeat protein